MIFLMIVFSINKIEKIDAFFLYRFFMLTKKKVGNLFNVFIVLFIGLCKKINDYNKI